MMQHYLFGIALVGMTHGSNWAQLAGQRSQNTATPYPPLKPMWSGRYGHQVVVLNQHTPRNYLTDEENSQRAAKDDPILVLLGGDDSLPLDTKNVTSSECMVHVHVILCYDVELLVFINCVCIRHWVGQASE